MGFFKRCRKKVCNELDEESTWSSRGFSNFHLESISARLCKTFCGQPPRPRQLLLQSSRDYPRGGGDF